MVAFAKRSDVVREFPFMAAVANGPPDNCGCNKAASSGPSARKAYLDALEAAKQTLVTLPDDKKALFKQMVGATKVFAYVRENGGTVEKWF